MYFILPAVSGGEHVDEIIGAAVADGKVTPKVQALIKILLKYQHTEDFRAIIFVERVVAALVLPKVNSVVYCSCRSYFCGFVRPIYLAMYNAGIIRASISKFHQMCQFDRAQQ